MGVYLEIARKLLAGSSYPESGEREAAPAAGHSLVQSSPDEINERDEERLVGTFPSNASAPATKELLCAGDTGETWDAALGELVVWAQQWTPPEEGFALWPWLWVENPERFAAALRGDISAGAGVGRAKYGALEADLRRLRVLFGGNELL